jgi:hypothetical protein
MTHDGRIGLAVSFAGAARRSARCARRPRCPAGAGIRCCWRRWRASTCTPEASTPRAAPVAQAVLGTLDRPAAPVLGVFRARSGARRPLSGVFGRDRRALGAELVMEDPDRPPLAPARGERAA